MALPSCRPETVQKDLEAANGRLTATSLSVPGEQQKLISAVATVAPTASTSATDNHAVVLLFVNQTIILGDGVPTSTTSSVRVTLDKTGGRWLDPV